MEQIRKVEKREKNTVKQIAKVHVKAFSGFFLTFMGEGFLRLVYSCYAKNKQSGLIVYEDEGKVLGFLAYSENVSGLYKYMIKTKLIPFMWYAFLAFLRKPKTFFRLFRALSKPKETARTEKYVELASICVLPDMEKNGIGTKLIDALKSEVDFSKYSYIALETDAENNDKVNAFYKKCGFKLERTYSTKEGRKMNEYRYEK